MSTRATYRFLQKNVTFYIHHDGYPRGAAHYIKACITEYGRLSADRFLRNNVRSEITPSPEIHGDTDFHYDIDLEENTVTVSEYVYHPERSLVVIHRGNVFEWINSHISEDRFFQVKTRYGTPYYTTMSALNKQLLEKQEELTHYRAAHPTAVGNISYMESEVHDLREMIAQCQKN